MTGSPLASTASACSTTSPSTQPPLTEPAISPPAATASLAPTPRGAEPSTRTTVASAVSRSSARQRANRGQRLIDHEFSMREMTDRSPVAAVILAAGLGRRFGFPKVAARLGEETLLSRVARLARKAELDPIVAVVPMGAETPARVEAVVNHDPARGLSTSLQLGINAAPADQAALILLVDQPTMEPATIAAVLAARGRKPIVAAWAEGRYGPPVLIEAEAFPLVMDLTGDIGLREILGAAAGTGGGRARSAAHAPDVDTDGRPRRLEARLEP